jgi:hypothetical protein
LSFLHRVSRFEPKADGPASHAHNVEVVTARPDFKHRILLIHLTCNRGKDATFWRERSTGFKI